MNFFKLLSNKLFLKLKNIFKKSYFCDDFSFGDVIYAKRYNNDIEKSNIDEGHQCGPFVVIKKEKNKAYALYCTSKIHDNYLKISSNLFEIKDTYIKTNKIYTLTEYHYIHKIFELDNESKNILYKELYLNNKRNLININLEYNIYNSVGDIIKFNDKLYYIYNVNEYLECVRLISSKNPKYKLIINKKVYGINFNENIKLNIGNYMLIDVVNEEIQLNIINMKRIHEEKCYPSKGKIIFFNKKYYYIYDENEVNYKVYLLSIKNISNNSIIINDKKYYIDFKSEKIDKNNKVKIIKTCSNLEKIKIDKLKSENRIKKKIQSNSGYSFKRYVVGSIIINCDTLERYVILNRRGNIITICNISNYKVAKDKLIRSNKYSYCGKLDRILLKNYLIKIKKKDH